MTDTQRPPSDISLPTTEQIRQAIDLYLAEAYACEIPPVVRDRLADEGIAPGDYLMSELVERTPNTVELSAVRTFAIRLGNSQYPNMKLRISRLPRRQAYLFIVDAHDEILNAPVGSPDHEPLEALKHHNAAVVQAICAAWDKAGLPTEKNFLREIIKQARNRKSGTSDRDSDLEPGTRNQ